jgi:hypothetical protein
MHGGGRGRNEGGRERRAGRRRWQLSSGARKALLAVHVIASVALIGSAACVLVVALLAAGEPGTFEAHVQYEALHALLRAVVIPFAGTALITGVALGLGTRWGVLRYRWVIAKLVLLVASLLTSLVVLGPSVLAAAINILFAATSTALSVYKPGGRRRTTPVHDRVARPGPLTPAVNRW